MKTVCFVSPMIGARHRGHVPTAGQTLAELFAADGVPVVMTSPVRNRYGRAADMVRTIARGRNRIDVVVIDTFSFRSFVVEDLVSRTALLFGLPTVFLLHGGDMPRFFRRFPRWTGLVLGRGRRLVAPSPYLARAVRSLGFDATVIPNVVDLARYPYRRRVCARPRLLWMRSFHAIYNPHLAIRAFARLRQRLPEATLVMAGPDGGLLTSTRDLAKRLGVAEAVRFAGFLDMPGKLREAADADIYINTNRVDNMPVSILEFCALGLPVVSTSVGGIPDLLSNRENALLVADDDATDMANAVEKIVVEPELAARLSAGGRALAEAFDWRKVRPKWDELLSSIVRGSRASEGSYS